MFGFNNKDQLIEKARAQAEKAPENYKSIVELYYFARFFVSVFEARNHQIPLQVWNEYRNALDHFIRHLTKTGLAPEDEKINTNQTAQIKAMKGHIQRATLDILKFICHETDKWFKEKHSSEEESIYSLVNDGHFLPKLYELHKQAEELFLNAKTDDGALGENAKHNKEILGRYLNAAFAYEELRSLFNENNKNISEARRQFLLISNSGKVEAQKKSFWPNVGANLTSNLIWLLTTLIAGVFIGRLI